jgi:hypothetical protein
VTHATDIKLDTVSQVYGMKGRVVDTVYTQSDRRIQRFTTGARSAVILQDAMYSVYDDTRDYDRRDIYTKRRVDDICVAMEVSRWIRDTDVIY